MNRFLLCALALSACTSGAVLEQDAKSIRQDIEKARDAGAIRCAQREFAMAESNLTFLANEIAEGDWYKADQHAGIARENIKTALRITDPNQCGEKRVLIKASPTPSISRKDSDGDGIFDDLDECPLAPGPQANKGCPYKDTDNDGLVDDIDQCPNDPGPQSNHGCPIKDSDGDGVLDPDDGCPSDPGPVANKGCPLKDRDGDTVTDDIDECPDVPGEPTNKGCPRHSLVFVRGDRIEIKQQVHFATGKAKILKDSYELLRQVASALRSNPSMRVRIEGHTDNIGSYKTNTKLSTDRAKSVRDHLITKEGVESERLESAGFGPAKPVASNSTAKGRALNRRVEFNIVN